MMVLSPLFGVIGGFSLGLTGGGSSIFAVPLLVYGLSVAPREAIGISLAAVGATALVGAIQRFLAGDIDLRIGLFFALAGMLGHHVVDMDVQTLKTQMDKGDILLVDVREPAEWAGECIPGAYLMPLSSFDPARLSKEPGKRLVLHCQSGNRSAQAGRALVATGWGTVCHLQGGLQAWKAAGFPSERSARAPVSLQRQVQITAGSLVLLGTVLGAFVSPWFLLLSGFVGAGLLVAGITDTCGMALLLAKLPYNQGV